MNERFEMGFPLPKALLHTPKQVDDGVQKESVKNVYLLCVNAFVLLTFSWNMGAFLVDIQKCNYYSDHI